MKQERHSGMGDPDFDDFVAVAALQFSFDLVTWVPNKKYVS
jgi:hypothetical protein